MNQGQRLSAASEALFKTLRALILEVLIALVILLRWLLEGLRLLVRFLIWFVRLTWRILLGLLFGLCAFVSMLALLPAYEFSPLPALMLVSVPFLFWFANQSYRRWILLAPLGLVELTIGYIVPLVIPALRVCLIVLIMIGARIYLERTIHGSAAANHEERAVPHPGPVDAGG